MTEKLLTTYEDGVTLFSFNNVRRKNAVDAEMMIALREGLAAAAEDGQTRAVVITGEGGAFCSGADVQSALADGGGADAVYHILTEAYGPTLLAIREFPFPVIAAIEGYAAGIGCDLALRCDLRLASETGVLAELFIRVGLIPDGGGTYLLPRLVGLGRAMELMFSGRDVPAQEALAIGLVNQVLPPENFRDAVMDYAKGIAAKAPLGLMRGKRAMLTALEGGTYAEALAREAQLQREIFMSEDGFEGFAAFLEKRPPRWKGR